MIRPDGVVSKKLIGIFKTLPRSLLCKFFAALTQKKYNTIDRKKMAMPLTRKMAK